MKRILRSICCVVVIIIVSAYSIALAEQDIAFRKIPWGSSIPEAEKLWDIPDYSFTVVENTVLGYEENYLDVYPSLNQTKVPSGHTALSYMFGPQVAGYDIASIYLYFRYGDAGNIKAPENAKFCAAQYGFNNIVDISGAYADLKGKLDSLYGKSIETTDEDSGTIYGSEGTQKYNSVEKISVWTDSSNAKVYLVSKTSDNPDALLTNYIYLVYLSPNYDDELHNTEAIATAFIMNEESENRSDSTDGL